METGGGSGSGNRSYRDPKQYYERDYPENYEWSDRYNNYSADNKKAAYPDSQDWARNNKSGAWQSKQDSSRTQYPESDANRRYEYGRGHYDRSYPPGNDYEQYYNSKPRYEESYPRTDDWNRKSYPRANNDDLKRTSYDSNTRGSGSGFNNNADGRKRTRSYPDDYSNNDSSNSRGGGSKYPPNRSYKGSTDTASPKPSDYKRLRPSRYDEESRDYDMQIGNETSSEFAEEPIWEDDKYGVKPHIPSNSALYDPNDPWGAPASPSDPNHWDNFWDNSWGPMPSGMSNTEDYNRRSSNSSRYMMMEDIRS